MKTQIPKGFTIVELLIVIVVIGILAAITLVAFNGVRNRANDASIQSDLSAAGKSIAAHHAIVGTYPASATQLTTREPIVSIRATRSAYDDTINNFIYCYGSGTAYALVAKSKSGKAFYVGSSTGNSVREYPYSFPRSQVDICPDAGAGSPGAGSGAWGLSPTSPTATWAAWTNQQP